MAKDTMNGRVYLACLILVLLVAGCAPSPTPALNTPAPAPSPTALAIATLTIPASPAPEDTVPLPSPTAPPASPTITEPLSPTPSPTPAPPTGEPAPTALSATAVPLLSEDSRIGAVFFGPGLNLDDLPCARLQGMGVRNTFFAAWWGEVEPQPGQYDWSVVDGPVDAAIACGIEPFLKITTSPRQGEDGVPPDDMAAYSRFVHDLAAHLKGRVQSYAIQNEIDNPRMVWTAETYGGLRAAAYDAIKRADPTARVLDSGFTMAAYLAAWINDYYQTGQHQEAAGMLERIQKHSRRKEVKNFVPKTEQEQNRWLGSDQNQRIIGLVEEMYAHPETYDAVQVHFLQDAWEMMPEYIGWIRTLLARAGTPDKPLEFWEIGFGWEADKEFTEVDHADGVVKSMVVALGEGGSRVVYEPYWERTFPGGGPPPDIPNRRSRYGRGLVTADGPRLAATAYRTTTQQLYGYQGASRIDLGPGTWTYRFIVPDGEVYVVWAEDARTVDLALEETQVTVTDIHGDAATADPATLAVGTSPVFVRTP